MRLAGDWISLLPFWRTDGTYNFSEGNFTCAAHCLGLLTSLYYRGVYTQNLWSFLDVGFICIYSIYVMLRLHGWRVGQLGPGEQAFDVLALAAPMLVPRLAFTLLSENLVLLCLRSMMADFFFLTALSAWCFFGFLLSLLWLGEGAHPIV